MNEEELQRLVVRLTGDSTSYNRMIQEAQGKIVQLERQVNNLGGTFKSSEVQASQFFNSVKSLAQDTIGVLGALGAKAELKEWLGIFEGKEVMMVKLSAAIEANGNDVKGVTEDYIKFAGAVSNATSIGKGETLALLQQAEAAGLTGDAAKRAAKNVIASRQGQHPMAIRQAVELEKGHVDRLAHVIPGLHDIKDPAMKAAKAQEYLNKQWKVAESVGNTLQGQTQKLTNIMKELKGELGAIVAEGFRPLLKLAADWLKWLKDLSPEIKRNIVIVTGLVAAFLSLRVALNYVSFAMAFLTNPLTVGFIVATAALLVFIHEMGGVEPALNKIREIFDQFKDSVIDNFYKVTNLVKEFIDNNRELTLGLVLTVSVVTALYTAYRIVVFTITTLNAIMSLLYIKQLALVSAWALWQVVMYAGMGTLALFKVFYLAFGAVATAVWTAITFVLGGHSVAVGLWAVMAGIGKAATWLWNAALVVFNSLLMGSITLIIALAAAIATLVVVGAGIIVVASAIGAIGTTAFSVMQVLTQLPTTFGPVSYIGTLFKGWYETLIDIWKVSRKDMPAAWEMLKIQGQIMVIQLKSLWPPLWTFISEGFDILWDLVKDVTTQKFKGMVATIARMFIEGDIAMRRAIFGNAVADAQQKLLQGTIDNLKAVERQQDDIIKKDKKIAANKLLEAANRFKIPEEGEEVKNLKKRLNEIRDQVLNPRWWHMGKKVEAVDVFPDLNPNINQVKELRKELGKLDAVLFGSAEAKNRISKYMAQLNMTPEQYAAKHGGKFPAGGGVQGQPFQAGGARADLGNRDILRDIRDLLQRQDQRGVAQIQAADLQNA